MDFQNWYRAHVVYENGVQRCPKVVCKSGLIMSIQASAFHYCSPRIDRAYNYAEFEVGFPNRRIMALRPYQERCRRVGRRGYCTMTESVYGFVPIDVIEEIIRKNGGIAVAREIRNRI